MYPLDPSHSSGAVIACAYAVGHRVPKPDGHCQMALGPIRRPIKRAAWVHAMPPPPYYVNACQRRPWPTRTPPLLSARTYVVITRLN